MNHRIQIDEAGHGMGKGLVVSVLLWMIFAAVRAYI